MKEIIEILEGLVEQVQDAAWCDCKLCHDQAREVKFDFHQDTAIKGAAKQLLDLVAPKKVLEIAKDQPFFIWERKILERLEESAPFMGEPVTWKETYAAEFIRPILEYAKADAGRIRRAFENELKEKEAKRKHRKEKACAACGGDLFPEVIGDKVIGFACEGCDLEHDVRGEPVDKGDQ